LVNTWSSRTAGAVGRLSLSLCYEATEAEVAEIVEPTGEETAATQPWPEMRLVSRFGPGSAAPTEPALPFSPLRA